MNVWSSIRLLILSGRDISWTKSVVSWIVYDIANTVFNLGVVGLFLPMWISNNPNSTDADLGFPIAISMIVVLVVSPFLGALTDQIRGRVRTFTFLNIIAVAATFLIGMGGSIKSGIFFFSVAFICVYLAELLYNTMLSDASTPKNRGRVGGIAAAVGNIGSLAIILFALQHDGINSFVFQVISIIILFAVLPMAMFFSEKSSSFLEPRSPVLASTWHQVRTTFRYFQDYPRVSRYFLARYFYMIAITTSSTFAVLYGINTMKFTEREVEFVFLIGILVAIPGTVIWGHIVDRLGSFTTLKINLLCWMLVLAGSATIPLIGLSNQFWWPLSAFTGFCFGGLWVSDKPLLIELSPSNLGQMFGIYGTISRAAFLTGSLLWPLVSVNLGLGQPFAVILLTFCIVVGLILLIRLNSFSEENFDHS